MNNKETKGIVYAALSALLYGILALFGTKLMQADYSVATMLFWRFLCASLVISPIIFIRKTDFKDIHLKEILISFLMGAIFYSASAGFYFVSTEYLGTGLAMVLFFTYPSLIAIMSYFIDDHKISKSHFIWLIVMFVGLTMLTDNSKHNFSYIGFAFAFINSLCYALYIFISKKQTHKIDPISSTFLVSIGNTLTFLCISLICGDFKLPNNLAEVSDIIIIGIICTLLPILLLLKALKYIHQNKASVISVIEPVVTVLVGAYFLNETMSLLQMLGIAAILISAIMIQND